MGSAGPQEGERRVVSGYEQGEDIIVAGVDV